MSLLLKVFGGCPDLLQRILFLEVEFHQRVRSAQAGAIALIHGLFGDGAQLGALVFLKGVVVGTTGRKGRYIRQQRHLIEHFAQFVVEVLKVSLRLLLLPLFEGLQPLLLSFGFYPQVVLFGVRIVLGDV